MSNQGVQERYQTAMKYAGEMHSEQKVPGTNANYLLHISNVTMEVLVAFAHSPDFDIELAIQAAILHDTVEDSDATVEDIRELFGNDVAEAVSALTKDPSIKDKNEKMQDSLNRINLLSKEVGMVKLADRITNLQPPPPHWSREKCLNYLEQAKSMSKDLAGKNEYLNKRLDSKLEEYANWIQDFDKLKNL
ncbi:MAG: bifunctional (p)ppGpp synthetase/guanosine-3',5'-bis(diphosphate) 3'-pyrophosphohydrolase [Flavobacteriales bacterium]|nr:bifunctional (p)ppGpp synthetase/guanosine-3',5'-bis(diphosphate) 3'-pyrophosphohydrolase [Flavobacteriales bacterium]